MSYNNRVAFLDEYLKLCEKYKCYIDTEYAKRMYVMEFMYTVDEAFERTVKKLEADLG